MPNTGTTEIKRESYYCDLIVHSNFSLTIIWNAILYSSNIRECEYKIPILNDTSDFLQCKNFLDKSRSEDVLELKKTRLFM